MFRLKQGSVINILENKDNTINVAINSTEQCVSKHCRLCVGPQIADTFQVIEHKQ